MSKDMMSRPALLALPALLAGLLLLALVGAAGAEVVDRIVAEVNNEIITLSELENLARAIEAQSGGQMSGKVPKDIQRKMLDAMIDRKLAKAEAKRRGLSVADKEVDQALERFKQRNNLMDDAALEKGLSQSGLTLKEFRQQIADQIIQERLLHLQVGSKATVSDVEVRRVYDEQYKQSGVQVHLRGVNLPFPPGATNAQKDEVKQKADAIIADLKQGRSMRDAARRHDAAEADLGYVAEADIDARLA